MDNSELLQAISTMLDTKLDAKLQPIETRLDNLETRFDSIETKVSNLQNDVTSLQKDVTIMKDDIRHIKHQQNFMFDEIERIHEIVLDHKNDASKHIA